MTVSFFFPAGFLLHKPPPGVQPPRDRLWRPEPHRINALRRGHTGGCRTWTIFCPTPTFMRKQWRLPLPSLFQVRQQAQDVLTSFCHTHFIPKEEQERLVKVRNALFLPPYRCFPLFAFTPPPLGVPLAHPATRAWPPSPRRRRRRRRQQRRRQQRQVGGHQPAVVVPQRHLGRLRPCGGLPVRGPSLRAGHPGRAGESPARAAADPEDGEEDAAGVQEDAHGDERKTHMRVLWQIGSC